MKRKSTLELNAIRQFNGTFLQIFKIITNEDFLRKIYVDSKKGQRDIHAIFYQQSLEKCLRRWKRVNSTTPSSNLSNSSKATLIIDVTQIPQLFYLHQNDIHASLLFHIYFHICMYVTDDSNWKIIHVNSNTLSRHWQFLRKNYLFLRKFRFIEISFEKMLQGKNYFLVRKNINLI